MALGDSERLKGERFLKPASRVAWLHLPRAGLPDAQPLPGGSTAPGGGRGREQLPLQGGSQGTPCKEPSRRPV